MARRSSNDPLVLVLDIGTSSVRGAIYDRHANRRTPLNQIRYSWHVDRSGRVDVPARLLEGIVRDAIDRTLSHTRRPIAAISVSTFWHSLMGLGRSGAASTPLYAWADTRSRAQAGVLRATEDEAAIHARTGCVFHSSYWPAKLVWLRETAGARFARSRHWISFGEFLERQWFGRGAVSLSTASATGLMDQRTCQWDKDVLTLCGIDSDRLGTLVDVQDTVTGLRPSLERRWPALAGARWLPPCGDGALSNVGCGCTTRDRTTLTIGTSGAMRVLWAPETTSEVIIPKGLWCYRLDRRRIVLGGALSNGGNVFGWLVRLLRTDAAPLLERALRKLGPDAHGLTMLPFLAGERSPDWPLTTVGTLTGLTLATRPAEIVRAALEAIAYRFALICERLDSALGRKTNLVATGGSLVRSPVWTEILAGVLNRPIMVSAVDESSCRGAAIVALAVLGVLPDIETMKAPIARPIHPRHGDHERYLQGMARHLRLEQALALSPQP